MLFCIRALARAVGGLLCSAGIAIADDPSAPDDHAPIGVMGDHLHRAGEFMFSYRAMFMDMHGNRDGQSNRTPAEVRRSFPVVPTQMRMAMHMLGAMYAPTDDWTLMGMAPYVRLDMDHVLPTGARFTTSSTGLGDVKLAALRRLWSDGGSVLIANLGVSLPTGSVDKKDRTPAGRVRLPYPMQLGSGTIDALPGLTLLHEHESGSWGAQVRATLRGGTNRRGYTLGNRGMATFWVAQRLATWLSASLRVEGQRWGNIHGADDDLAPKMVPTADPDRRAGTRVDVLFGVNTQAVGGPLFGHRLAVEFGVPVYQSLDGPQLETDWQLVVGWQKAF